MNTEKDWKDGLHPVQAALWDGEDGLPKLRELLDAGLDSSALVGDSGATTLEIAITCSNSKAVEMIIDHPRFDKASVFKVNSRLVSPYKLAVSMPPCVSLPEIVNMRKREIASLFRLRFGSPVVSKSIDGSTFFMYDPNAD